MEDDQFYILDITHERGDLELWWKPNRCGYTSCLDQAGVYSRREAEQIQKIRGTDIPYSKAVVDAAAHRVVFRHTLARTP